MITILELATFRLGKQPLTGADFEKVRLPIMGGCSRCEATIAAFNAYPAKDGFLKCSGCIGADGWEDVRTANREIFEDEFKEEPTIREEAEA